MKSTVNRPASTHVRFIAAPRDPPSNSGVRADTSANEKVQEHYACHAPMHPPSFFHADVTAVQCSRSQASFARIIRRFRVFFFQGRAIRSDSVRNDTRRVAARTRLFFRQYLPPHPPNRASIAGGGDVSEPGRAWITDAGARAILTTGFLRPMLSKRASQTEGGCDRDRCPIDDAPIPAVR